MRKLVVAVSLLVLFAGVAVAQTRGSNGASSGQSGPVLTVPDSSSSAPVGHRQPRASDMPNERNLSDPNDPLNKENKVLDRKIKSICRGC